ncbi:hypothetical protein DFP72DRAFT_848411 [Ephemerocybe angulata]|uniref:Uncharacterized protein n=1 Tax=Ephemerocybe angulata TaxID=980116 RepID=A0A8H6HVX3_9AGAR|nr:hypothetical protein DFP72DRAFT_848411 [Tulosesus angulatus]
MRVGRGSGAAGARIPPWRYRKEVPRSDIDIPVPAERCNAMPLTPDFQPFSSSSLGLGARALTARLSERHKAIVIHTIDMYLNLVTTTPTPLVEAAKGKKRAGSDSLIPYRLLPYSPVLVLAALVIVSVVVGCTHKARSTMYSVKIYGKHGKNTWSCFRRKCKGNMPTGCFQAKTFWKDPENMQSTKTADVFTMSTRENVRISHRKHAARVIPAYFATCFQYIFVGNKDLKFLGELVDLCFLKQSWDSVKSPLHAKERCYGRARVHQGWITAFMLYLPEWAVVPKGTSINILDTTAINPGTWREQRALQLSILPSIKEFECTLAARRPTPGSPSKPTFAPDANADVILVALNIAYLASNSSDDNWTVVHTVPAPEAYILGSSNTDDDDWVLIDVESSAVHKTVASLMQHIESGAAKSIKSRHVPTYAAPRKCKEAWATIIKGHLDAGHIQPSSSHHASPSFLIPKPDLDVLPRWAIGFRALNANVRLDRHPLSLPRIDDILADAGHGKNAPGRRQMDRHEHT